MIKTDKIGRIREFRKVAVLGAGVMGAQIAAHLVNAKVPCMLFDLPAKGEDKNGIAKNAIANLSKLKPAPFALPENAELIRPANYEEHLALLSDCDLVIEAISERFEWKRDLYAKISPYLEKRLSSGETLVFATNTSGLSINSLAEVLPSSIRSRFCGIHFFNPPRYMQLVELIPHNQTAPDLLDELETFVTATLGKGVVRAKDTPNFIANRVGVFSMLSVMKRAEEFGIAPDLVDALTGPLIGRPKSATFRTADVVGLDTLSHVVENMSSALKSDPWLELYVTPDWITKLIAAGAVGQKAGAGIYKKMGKDIHVFDPVKKDFRASDAEAPAEIVEILKKQNPSEMFNALRNHNSHVSRFLWSIFSDIFHYSAVLLDEIAFSARDIDWSMRYGYGWARGPFEIWQSAGWQSVANWVQEDIREGRSLAPAPLPNWVFDGGRAGVHSNEGSFSPREKRMLPKSSLPVYRRQIYPDLLVGESVSYGDTIFENAGVRFWTTGDEIGVLSFKSKMHAVGNAVLDGCLESLERAKTSMRGVVIWQTEPPFCAGANLKELADAAAGGRFSEVESMVARFQQTSQALKYSPVPVVAAPQGLALGGGCEILMHCAGVTPALETYAGLVEIGVGLLPAGGGCKEFAIRAADQKDPAGLIAALKPGFENIAMAKVSASALEAQLLGYLKHSDQVVFHPSETLYVAKSYVNFLSAGLFKPAVPGRRFPVAGRPGIATFEMILVNMAEGGFISEHDYNICKRIATVLCGGEVDEGTLVDEDWILELERKHFMALCETAKTQERVAHMLKTGKPLRN